MDPGLGAYCRVSYMFHCNSRDKPAVCHTEGKRETSLFHEYTLHPTYTPKNDEISRIVHTCVFFLWPILLFGQSMA
jgi:hypothetical protein